MARVTAPLMSLDASGSIAKTLVASKWKGKNYMRIRVIPYNPKSAYQTGIRLTQSLGVMYFTKGSYVSASAKTWWNTYAEGMGMSGWNRFLKQFIQNNYDNATGTFKYAGIPQPN